ncbi:DUF6712 family protein [Costertonia aggregata]|uniref:Uncharacterized protein n=1 Tax=Costertonia aggregata TaxID=343403 RepID=A0A7H9ARF0_9FLAO|nr:hypothetical protein [Costertonia aggregata]QLG46058.1 hypothetical protein HYG79_12115 [Costertonia aggregata]
MTTILISASDLTKRTPMAGNIDPNKYTYCIREAQIFVIEPILGTKLYKKIVADYEANTLTGDYLELMENYVKPILIYTVSAEFILVHSYNVQNGGIFKNSPENSEPVNKSEVDFLVQKQHNKADAYIERMKKFLSSIELPEYNTVQENNYDTYPDKTLDFTGGWKLGSYSKGNDFLKPNER